MQDQRAEARRILGAELVRQAGCVIELGGIHRRPFDGAIVMGYRAKREQPDARLQVSADSTDSRIEAFNGDLRIYAVTPDEHAFTMPSGLPCGIKAFYAIHRTGMSIRTHGHFDRVEVSVRAIRHRDEKSGYNVRLDVDANL
ncbi:MAG: hypothetical protein AB7F50_02505 [Fimbriimonadaceae bacterium]